MKIRSEVVVKSKRIGILSSGVKVPMIENEKKGDYVMWYGLSMSIAKNKGDIINLKKVKVGSKICGLGILGVQ